MMLTRCSCATSFSRALLVLIAFHISWTEAVIPIVHVPDDCTDGFTSGTDIALLTIPYPPSDVISIVGDFSNLTWSGTDPSNIELNGTDNEPGTARQYTLMGLNVIETLFEYYRPELHRSDDAMYLDTKYSSDVAYAEAHNFAQVNSGGNNVYIPFDGLTVQSTCGGRASTMNYTAAFCANDAGTAQSQLHALHMQDLQNVKVMLGNNTFTDCESLRSTC